MKAINKVIKINFINAMIVILIYVFYAKISMTQIIKLLIMTKLIIFVKIMNMIIQNFACNVN